LFFGFISLTIFLSTACLMRNIVFLHNGTKIQSYPLFGTPASGRKAASPLQKTLEFAGNFRHPRRMARRLQNPVWFHLRRVA
jgi:hypothetical protein